MLFFTCVSISEEECVPQGQSTNAGTTIYDQKLVVTFYLKPKQTE